MRAMAGFDSNDSTSIDAPVPDYSAALAAPIDGLRIGVPREYFGEGLDSRMEATIRASLAELERQGATLMNSLLRHWQAHWAKATKHDS